MKSVSHRFINVKKKWTSTRCWRDDGGGDGHERTSCRRRSAQECCKSILKYWHSVRYVSYGWFEWTISITLTVGKSSICAEVGPADGSLKPLSTLEFTRSHPNWFPAVSRDGLVLICAHCVVKLFANVPFLKTLFRLLVELTKNWFESSGWSWRFCPTPGDCTTVFIPWAESCFESPTPLRSSSWGLLMGPAERITSLLARTVRRGPRSWMR